MYDAGAKVKRAAAEQRREDDAVKALQGMGAHLAVLASNPALLARALKEAGLAPSKTGNAVSKSVNPTVKRVRRAA